MEDGYCVQFARVKTSGNGAWLYSKVVDGCVARIKECHGISLTKMQDMPMALGQSGPIVCPAPVIPDVPPFQWVKDE